MDLKFIHIILLIFSGLTALESQDCFEADASIWLNTWSSCIMKENPNPKYGASHWIMYDMGEIRNMSRSWVWNCNDPSELDQGFELAAIDYSIDGSNWTHWGEFNFPKAEGTAIYPGFPGPDLEGVSCQFILITVISNHGDENCSGIAEIKFNLLPGFEESIISKVENIHSVPSKYSISPSPAIDLIHISGELKEIQDYFIINSYGMIVQKGVVGYRQNSIPLSTLSDGIYFLKIEDQTSRFMKVN